jgi:hypothetical protein
MSSRPAVTYINIPEWNGHARKCGELWTLRKGKRVASCHLFTHPLGGEVRVEVDGEMIRTQAGRDGMTLVNFGLEWKQQFQEKGWTA